MPAKDNPLGLTPNKMPHKIYSYLRDRPEKKFSVMQLAQEFATSAIRIRNTLAKLIKQTDEIERTKEADGRLFFKFATPANPKVEPRDYKKEIVAILEANRDSVLDLGYIAGMADLSESIALEALEFLVSKGTVRKMPLKQLEQDLTSPNYAYQINWLQYGIKFSQSLCDSLYRELPDTKSF